MADPSADQTIWLERPVSLWFKSSTKDKIVRTIKERDSNYVVGNQNKATLFQELQRIYRLRPLTREKMEERLMSDVQRSKLPAVKPATKKKEGTKTVKAAAPTSKDNPIVVDDPDANSKKKTTREKTPPKTPTRKKPASKKKAPGADDILDIDKPQQRIHPRAAKSKSKSSSLDLEVTFTTPTLKGTPKTPGTAPAKNAREARKAEKTRADDEEKMLVEFEDNFDNDEDPGEIPLQLEPCHRDVPEPAAACNHYRFSPEGRFYPYRGRGPIW